jgi:serine/threonine protein kinase
MSAVSPRTIGGRYVLHDELASGGMATVHIGRLIGAAGFSRTVAIKRLHPQYAKEADFVSMFIDEARIAARIRHPNVVATIDTVSVDGELFLVMELVLGDTLARLARAPAMIPVEIAVAIAGGVLHGLHAAHEARDERGVWLEIVHRDVSPQNVIVGADGLARVLDFGVAKALGRLQTTQQGEVKGKVAYMAPEQLRGGKVDRRTDVYAAAVVLWETLAGRRLFVSDSPAETMARVLEQPVEPPSTYAPGVPPALAHAVARRCARVTRDHRRRSGRAVLDGRRSHRCRERADPTAAACRARILDGRRTAHRDPRCAAGAVTHRAGRSGGRRCRTGRHPARGLREEAAGRAAGGQEAGELHPAVHRRR